LPSGTKALHKKLNLKIVLGVGVCLTLIVGMPAFAADSKSSEYAVKAAIVHKIAKFVTWPESLDGPGGETLSICLPELDPIAPAIEALSGEIVQGRLIKVLRLDEVANPTVDCKILYLSRPSRDQYLGLIDQVADSPVLTIGDSQDFVSSGGIVLLEIKKEQIQFAINVGASQRAGLEISAQLLQLATISE
jgi:hypothetical protein